MIIYTTIKILIYFIAHISTIMYAYVMYTGNVNYAKKNFDNLLSLLHDNFITKRSKYLGLSLMYDKFSLPN